MRRIVRWASNCNVVQEGFFAFKSAMYVCIWAYLCIHIDKIVCVCMCIVRTWVVTPSAPESPKPTSSIKPPKSRTPQIPFFVVSVVSILMFQLEKEVLPAEPSMPCYPYHPYQPRSAAAPPCSYRTGDIFPCPNTRDGSKRDAPAPAWRRCDRAWRVTRLFGRPSVDWDVILRFSVEKCGNV